MTSEANKPKDPKPSESPEPRKKPPEYKTPTHGRKTFDSNDSDKAK
jgi:hypothetical protein